MHSQDDRFDVIIIGGGINGCACAADAALRGLKVLLCEQHTLASETSSKSSKLIHGGLRYLEYYDFSMVKHALKEREILLNMAPHLVRPLPFILPIEKQYSRAPWRLKTGLFLYDHLFHSKAFHHHRSIHRKKDPLYFSNLKPTITEGFLYYDAQTNDQRLVIHNALQAKKYGAVILNHTQCIHIETNPSPHSWRIVCRTQGTERIFYSTVLVNATGAHVSSFNKTHQLPQNTILRFIQGSHLVVPKLYLGDHAYILQDKKTRIVFALPQGEHYTLIGTTEKEHLLGDAIPTLTAEETSYLLETINAYFNTKITEDQITSHFSGMRTLVHQEKNSTAISRDYAYEVHRHPGPYINILSGKITTYRRLAEAIIDELSVFFNALGPSKTAHTPLVGAPLNQSWDMFVHDFRKTYDWLSFEEQNYYLQTYGTLSLDLLASVQSNTKEQLKKVEEHYLDEESHQFL